MRLRPYQERLVDDINTSWSQGHRNVIAVAPCGAGKTACASHIVSKINAPTVVIAHRRELVGQMALALARCGVPHSVIGPKSLRNFVQQTQYDELGTSFYRSNAQCAVAGVDTLIKRGNELSSWMAQVKLWVTDEAHHITANPINKWGTGVEMFPNALGLGFTATPCRADGRGLGRHTDGVFDTMVEGPTMRELIDQGWLTDYTLVCPKTADLNLAEVTITSSGDYSKPKLKTAVQKSSITGDVVKEYLRHASGKLGITFANDVESAVDIADAYNAAGVPAEVVTANTPDNLRNEIVKRFRNRQLLQLVNVDLFGEGFDLPAVEVISMARPTQSYSLYHQQFCRALRIIATIPDKIAMIIDHVGNVERHGLPDKDKIWSLDSREKRPRSKNVEDDIPLRYCPKCTKLTPRTKPACMHCGYEIIPAARSSPKFVDGDLYQLDAATLAKMRSNIDKINNPEKTLESMKYARTPQVIVNSFKKNALARIEMQTALLECTALWAGHQKAKGLSLRESHRLFYHLFKTDILTAQTLGRTDALALMTKVFTNTWEIKH